jgi:hypothetical protein
MRTRKLCAYVIGLAGAVACLAPFGGTAAAAAPTAQDTVSVTGLPPAAGGVSARHEKSPDGVRAVYGPFNVRAQNSNKCLDVRGGTGATGDGSPVQIWDCYGAAQTNQQWYFQDTGDPFVYNLIVRHSGRCLDIAGGTGAVYNGNIAQQWGCLGYYQTNQKWLLSEYTVDGRTIYKLNAMHSGKCLDVTGGTGAINNGTQVQQWDCLGDAQTNQRWYLTTP